MGTIRAGSRARLSNPGLRSTRSVLTASDASLDGVLLEELAALERAGLRRTLRPLHGRIGAHIADRDRGLLDFASNDYLGLASDPRLAMAAAAAPDTAGNGAAAARLISGHRGLHGELELALARFAGAEAALL